MVASTKNHDYFIVDEGDGAFLISGHPIFCPIPQLVTIQNEIKVGERIWFEYVGDNPLAQIEGNLIRTTEVISIEP